MHARQASILETLRAVQAFLDAKKADIAPVNESGARKSLDAVVEQLTKESVDQTAGHADGKGGTALQARLRDELRLGHMKPVAEIAKARLRDVPEMHAFAFPVSTTPSTRLVALAGAMVDASQKHEAVLVESGMPQDFIAQLNTAATALMDSLSGRTQSVSRGLGATSALLALEKQGRAALRVINALVTPKLRLNDRVLGEWRGVKAVHKKRGPAQGSTPAPSTPTASNPAAIVPSSSAA